MSLPRLLAAMLAAMLVLANAALAAQPAADVYVSPQGDDRWSGTLPEPNAAKTDGPLATVQHAQQRVRELKKQPDRKGPVVVMLRGGVYYLQQPLVFTPEDSGSEQAPVIYQAHGQERPVLSGGTAISAWQVGSDGRWTATLDDVKAGKWNFTQLFVNDQRRFRPRLPKQGYFQIAKQLKGTGARGPGHDCFEFAGEDLRADWTNREDIEIVSFHQWTASRMRVASVDAQKRVVVFTGTAYNSPWAAYGKGHRYFVENVREALSTPGQWYLDRPSGQLTYIPRDGEKPEQALVIAPRLERILVLAGDLPGKRWVEHLQFRGLTLAHANWVVPLAGQAFPQADINMSAALTGVGARNITIDGCAIRNVGAYAAGFGAGCRQNRLENCELVDLGGGGVKIGHATLAEPGSWNETGRVPSGPEELVSHHTVRNCLIAQGGRIQPAAVGVWIGHSPYNTVQNNEIVDFYYTGVSVGWIWGYRESQAHHNIVSQNHIHKIGQGVLSDMGGIYCLGVSPGTVLSQNHIHDIHAFSYGGWGLYTDEGSTGILLENNLVYRTKTGGFHQHYGKENRVENNIFAFAVVQQIQRTRTEPHTSFFFRRNIVYWDNDSPLLGSNWKDNNFRMEQNCYYHAGGKPVLFPGKLTLEEWQKKRGQDEGSIIADPKFEDPKAGNFRLKPDSPALKLGFKPIDVSQSGRTTPPVLTKDLPPAPAAFE